jgi:glycine/D-amino acid oxidase-like deaminating enzyme
MEKKQKKMSRRSFIGGVATGAASIAIGGNLLKTTLTSSMLPPSLGEEISDCYWYDSIGFYSKKHSPRLKAKQTQCDIAILGGGFTGLSAAICFKKRFPQKRIVLIEGSRCGNGGSGRNGGQLLATNFSAVKRPVDEQNDINSIMKTGIRFARDISEQYNIDADFYSGGILALAHSKKAAKYIQDKISLFDKINVGYEYLDEKQIRNKIKSDMYYGGLTIKDDSLTIHPAKLAVGLKGVAEHLRVEIYEHTKVVHIETGSKATAVTEYGNVMADNLILATNAFSHKIGIFKSKYVPVSCNVLATAPLTNQQITDTGWQNREQRITSEFETHFMQLTPDKRIVFGGGNMPYNYNGELNCGNHRPTLNELEKHLFVIWPKLKGLKVTHKWSGYVCFTLDALPSYGVLPKHGNMYYAAGYSGEGVSMAMAAGPMILDAFEGKKTTLTKSMLFNKKLKYIPFSEPVRGIGFNIGKMVMS